MIRIDISFARLPRVASKAGGEIKIYGYFIERFNSRPSKRLIFFGHLQKIHVFTVNNFKTFLMCNVLEENHNNTLIKSYLNALGVIYETATR